MGTTKHENTVVVRAGIKPAPTQFQLAGPMNNEKTTVVGAGFIPALTASFRGYRRWAMAMVKRVYGFLSPITSCI